MSKKIIFFDIDGTLLDHEKNLPQTTKSAVQSLKDKGYIVAIATGRAPFMFKELREELEIDSYISFNGQYIVLNGEVFYKNPLQREALGQLTDKALSLEHPVVYMDHDDMKANTPHHQYIEDSISTLKFSHPQHDPDYFLTRELFYFVKLEKKNSMKKSLMLLNLYAGILFQQIFYQAELQKRKELSE